MKDYSNKTTTENRIAVLLARYECRDHPAAVAACDAFLRMYHVIEEPNFTELSQPIDKGSFKESDR